jgi:undecaprenyl-diphosphatase
MTVWQAIWFGALQGVTEFLPVSSSGHLVILRAIWNITGVSILFDILLHVATLAVVCIVFRRRIWDLLRAIGLFLTRRAGEAEKLHLRWVLLIIIATVFTGIIGFVIESMDIGDRPRLVSALFLVTAAVLIVSRYVKPGNDREGRKFMTGVVCGIAQGFGVLPGISRSGITISAALMSGLERDKAGEFSFLLSIPAILGALVLKMGDTGDLLSAVEPVAIIVGVVTSFAVGMGALILLLRLVKRGKLHLFALYLVPLGVFGLIFL